MSTRSQYKLLPPLEGEDTILDLLRVRNQLWNDIVSVYLELYNRFGDKLPLERSHLPDIQGQVARISFELSRLDERKIQLVNPGGRPKGKHYGSRYPRTPKHLLPEIDRIDQEMRTLRQRLRTLLSKKKNAETLALVTAWEHFERTILMLSQRTGLSQIDCDAVREEVFALIHDPMEVANLGLRACEATGTLTWPVGNSARTLFDQGSGSARILPWRTESSDHQLLLRVATPDLPGCGGNPQKLVVWPMKMNPSLPRTGHVTHIQVSRRRAGRGYAWQCEFAIEKS